MKKFTTLLLASLFISGSFPAHAMDSNDQDLFLTKLKLKREFNNTHLTQDIWEGVFFTTLRLPKCQEDNVEQYKKDVKNQATNLSLVCASFYCTLANPTSFPIKLLSSSSAKITPGKYFLISQPRILEQQELDNIFNMGANLNSLVFLDVKLPVTGLTEDQVTILSRYPHLRATLTCNDECQLELKKSMGTSLPNVKLMTYKEKAKSATKQQERGYSLYNVTSDMLISRIDKLPSDQRDALLNLVGQIKNLKIDEDTVKELTQFQQGHGEYLIDKINSLGAAEVTAKSVRLLGEMHPSEVNDFITQLQALKSISLSLESKIECLNAVHFSERDDFAKHISFIKGPVKDFKSIMLKLKDIHPSELGAFVAALNLINEAKIYYFDQNFHPYKLESIDDQLIESLKKVSRSSEERTTFVNLLVEYMKGEKLDCKTLDKLAEIRLEDLPAFLKQLQALKPTSLSLDSKIDCLKSIHPSELEALVAALKRLNDAKMYYFDQTYHPYKVENINAQLISSLRKVSRSSEERTVFVNLLVEYLKGEKLDHKMLEKLAEIHLKDLPTFLGQLQTLKPVSLSLESKIDCLKAVHAFERDDFVKHVLSIKGPVKDFKGIMLKLKDVHFSQRGALVADLNRLNDAKIYYYQQSYDYKNIESIDDQLVESLRKVSHSSAERTVFVDLLLTYLKGQKLDISLFNKLAAIPLAKLESALVQVISMDSKESLYSRINKINMDALYTS